MATRFCGTAAIKLTWDDELDAYVGRIFDPTKASEERSYRFKVRAPAYLTEAVDSPAAYDKAAHAACAFAQQDDYDFFFDSDEKGYKIFRNRAAQDFWYTQRRMGNGQSDSA